MHKTRPMIAVVDDDPRLLTAGRASGIRWIYRLLLWFGQRPARSRTMNLDLLITDIGMPGINGFELRDRVKSACPELPVFLTTGRHEIADQGGAQSVNGFFRKPFDAPDLLVAVCKALRKSRDRG